jgi:hypothetical protein
MNAQPVSELNVKKAEEELTAAETLPSNTPEASAYKLQILTNRRAKLRTARKYSAV